MTTVYAEAPPPIVHEPHGTSYATSEQLGKGGFAICYKAERLQNNQQTGHIVALKIVKSKMEPPKLAQKFVTELQIHSKLSHPNIVTFHRAFSFAESTYVVLELCSCGSLADLLRRRKCLTMPEIRRLIIQVSGAVKYLHMRNIVHRDLKTGNLFLDEHMNVKVGDFGLAALLVSGKDMDVKRRTTMCGTPNYLAPELLEKGKGHNEKVDLWAIGIISYTLAVGKAPFHAASKEEVYKKLKAGEYSWPELSSITNDISADLRDLVSALLVPEELRPCPDKIVAHPFFKMAYVPTKMSRSQATKVPTWPVTIPSSEVLARGYTDSWLRVCRETGVGEFAPGKCFQSPGSQRIRSVVREIEKEITTGQQPSIPITADTVYVGNGSTGIWDSQIDPVHEPVSQEKTTIRPLSYVKDPVQNGNSNALAIPKATNVRDTALMPPPKRPNDLTVNKTRTEPNIIPAEPLRTIRGTSPRKQMTTMAMRSTSALRLEPDENRDPDIASGKIRPVDASLAQKPSTSRRNGLTRRLPDSVEKEMTTRSDALLVRTTRSRGKKAEAETIKIFDDDTKPRLTADNLILPPVPDMRAKLPIPQQKNIEKSSVLTGSSPDVIMQKLKTLRHNLEDVLLERQTQKRDTMSEEQPKLPFVSRWVDNSKKYGVGYILQDGTAGVIVSATEPAELVLHAIARRGEAWLRSIGKRYENLEKVPLHILENREEGIGRASLAIKIEKDQERIQTLKQLWVKFGRYMSQGVPLGESVDNSQSDLEFVRLYQRAGNVGIWAFADGCIQMNFPDHTKLVVSADGYSVSATLVSIEGAMAMAVNNVIPSGMLSNRQVFALSTAQMVQLSRNPSTNDQVTRLLRANMIEEKLEFLGQLLDQWIGGGGLGCARTTDSRLQWEGLWARDSVKSEWTTVGRHGGD